MIQMDLFNNPQLSSRTDKPTSHEAGDGVRPKLGQLQKRCLDTLGGDSMTAMELADKCEFIYGGIAESYRKRMKELVRDGLIEELPPRECSVTGKSATVYKQKT